MHSRCLRDAFSPTILRRRTAWESRQALAARLGPQVSVAGQTTQVSLLDEFLQLFRCQIAVVAYQVPPGITPQTAFATLHEAAAR